MENNLYSYLENMFKGGNIPSFDELDKLMELTSEGKTKEELIKMNEDFYRDGFMRDLLNRPMMFDLIILTAPFLRSFENPDFNIYQLHFYTVALSYVTGAAYADILLDSKLHFSNERFKNNFLGNKNIKNTYANLINKIFKEHSELGYASDECLQKMRALSILVIKITAECRTKAEIFDIYFKYVEPMDWRKLSGMTDEQLKKYSKKEVPELPPFLNKSQPAADMNFEWYKTREKGIKKSLRQFHEEIKNNQKYPDSVEKAAEIAKIYNTYCKYEDFKTDDESLENYSFEEINAYHKAMQVPEHYHKEIYTTYILLSIIYNLREPGDKSIHYMCNHRRLSQCIAFTIYPYSLKYDNAISLYVELQYNSRVFIYPKDIKKANRYRINKIKERRDNKKD